METDGGERDAWADPGEASMAVASIVEAIGSDASAMCLGRFGQHVLVGTESGAVRLCRETLAQAQEFRRRARRIFLIPVTKHSR